MVKKNKNIVAVKKKSTNLLLLAVLYLYIARIALIRILPSGQLNWFGCLVLLGTLFFWVGIRKIGRAHV